MKNKNYLIEENINIENEVESHNKLIEEKPNIYIGLECHYIPNLLKMLEDSRKNSFDFIVIPLIHPRNERDLLNIYSGKKSKEEPFTRSDTILNSSQWTSMIVGKISPWIEVDSTIDDIRKNSQKVI